MFNTRSISGVVFNAMTARKFVALRVTPEAHAFVQALADVECEGNFSEMMRRLLKEAIAARKNNR